MKTYLVTIDETQFVNEPETVFMNLKGVKTIEETTFSKKNEIIYDPNIYDENGNFQWISLASPGLPVPDEYMAWKLEKVQNSIAQGKGKSLDEVMTSFEKRVKRMLPA